LGLATDGINPFAEKHSTWSTWPVTLLNYNLPPWLTTKKHFLMLSLIIPSEESVTSDNMDTYLQPLLEELQLLWHGVWVRDVANYNGIFHFKLKAILMWCIHDFPTFGNMASCVTKWLSCMPNLWSPNFFSSINALSKHVYCNQHRRWLPLDHPFRENLAAFDGIHETQLAPPRVEVDDII